MKKITRFGLLLMSLALFLISSSLSFAADTKEAVHINKPYVIVNGTYIVYEGEDFESPATGEYVHWSGARGIDKEFTFKIRYSVESSKFTVNSEKVLVSADAHIEDMNGGYVDGYYGHLYTVSINGWHSKSLQFSVGNEQSGTISGLKKDGDYRVEITNNDYLDSTKYLVGSGTVSTF